MRPKPLKTHADSGNSRLLFVCNTIKLHRHTSTQAQQTFCSTAFTPRAHTFSFDCTPLSIHTSSIDCTPASHTPAKAQRTSSASLTPAKAQRTSSASHTPAKAQRTSSASHTPAKAQRTSSASHTPAKAQRTSRSTAFTPLVSLSRSLSSSFCKPCVNQAWTIPHDRMSPRPLHVYSDPRNVNAGFNHRAVISF